MSQLKIAVLVGSLRVDSFNRRLARAIEKLAPAEFGFKHVQINDLPLYSQDFDAAYPAAAIRLKKDIESADGLLFVTPEYNRSVSAVLKNAVDVGSRPIGKSIWAGKPAAVVSSSPGAIGGFGANHHLRQSLVALSVPVMPMEAYLGGIDKLFESGTALVPKTQEFAVKIMQAFARWIDHNAA